MIISGHYVDEGQPSWASVGVFLLSAVLEQLCTELNEREAKGLINITLQLLFY